LSAERRQGRLQCLLTKIVRGPESHSLLAIFNALPEMNGSTSTAISVDHDGPGWRQRLNLCSPLHGKASVADFEDYPLADYILCSGPLRKLDDTRHRMRSSVRRTAIPAWSAFVCCELPHCYRATILAFSYSRHQCSS